MKEIILLTINVIACCQITLYTQEITFERTYGGTDRDWGSAAQTTSDNGYIIVGSTNSFGVGNYDIYLVKTDSLGDTIWTKTYGSINDEYGSDIKTTTDGGYIISGSTYQSGNDDIYLIKTNSDGDTLWTKTYGGTGDDYALSVQQTLDGGYMLAGSTNGSGAGDFDTYLLKTNSSGDTLWTKTFGGVYYDDGWGGQQTSDGGYIITGGTYSFGNNVGVTDDVYLIKTNSLGDTLWTKTFGGVDLDWANDVYQTADGGYIITGLKDYVWSTSNTGDVYLIKTNSLGDTLWTRTFGGTYFEQGQSVKQTTDMGYILTGIYSSIDSENRDLYLVKTNTNGDTLWTRTFGGINDDGGSFVQQDADGGYIITGYKDRNTITQDGDNIYLIKTDSLGNVNSTSGINNASFTNNRIKIYPNPTRQLAVLEFDNPKQENHTLTLFDAQGRAVKTITNITKNQVIIDRGELISALYFFQLCTDRQVYATGKLIME